jgi:hypothetical protein
MSSDSSDAESIFGHDVARPNTILELEEDANRDSGSVRSLVAAGFEIVYCTPASAFPLVNCRIRVFATRYCCMHAKLCLCSLASSAYRS